MKLFGSTTSPYVRRIRLLLKDCHYEFENINIFDPEVRKRLQELSPILKIPLLDDHGQIILDSRQIFYHLCKKNLHVELTYEQENLLTIIDGVQDSLINIFMLNRSEIVYDSNALLITSHRDRIDNGFQYLNQLAKKDHFCNWNYLSIALYSLIEWAQFRNLQSFDCYPEIQKFYSYIRSLNNEFEIQTRPKL